MERRDFLKATIAALAANACLPLLKVEAGGRRSSTNIFTEPPAIEPLTGYLGRFKPVSTGGMTGDFRASYTLVQCNGSTDKGSRVRPDAGSLSVESVGNHLTTTEIRSRGASTVKTEIDCGGRDGAVSKWTLSSSVKGVEGCGFTEKGTWDGGRMAVQSSTWKQEHATSNPLVARWSLLRRLASGIVKNAPLKFDMLDDSTLRPSQTLRYTGRIEVPIGRGKVRLDCYAQTGRAVVPIHYLVDDAGRVQLITQSNVNWALAALR